MSAQDAAAFLALLDADNDAPALVPLDGEVPNGVVPPYALLYFYDSDPELTDSRALTSRSERHVTWAVVHNVAESAEGALMVADRSRAALLDVKPTIAGRRCFPIRREDGQPPRRDETTGTAVFDKVDVYRLESVPS